MKLSSNDLFLLSRCAISAAYQAGQIISTKSRHPVKINTKKGGTSLASQVVTEVDHLSQAVILKNLIPTCEIFDLALLSEESPDNLERLEKDYFWCIDPLDGTLPFVQSTPGYAVSIALVSREGAPLIGVVYDPVKQTLYHAVKGNGAFRNGKPWKIKSASTSSATKLTLIADRSFEDHPLYSTVIAELNYVAVNLGYDGLNTLLQGGAAMNACWVLEKSPACYFKFPKPQDGGGSLWDYAATACLFIESGAVVSDIYGNSLDLNRPDSTFMNHRGVLYSSSHDLANYIMDLYSKLRTD